MAHMSVIVLKCLNCLIRLRADDMYIMHDVIDNHDVM